MMNDTEKERIDHWRKITMDVWSEVSKWNAGQRIKITEDLQDFILLSNRAFGEALREIERLDAEVERYRIRYETGP